MEKDLDKVKLELYDLKKILDLLKEYLLILEKNDDTYEGISVLTSVVCEKYSKITSEIATLSDKCFLQKR